MVVEDEDCSFFSFVEAENIEIVSMNEHAADSEAVESFDINICKGSGESEICTRTVLCAEKLIGIVHVVFGGSNIRFTFHVEFGVGDFGGFNLDFGSFGSLVSFGVHSEEISAGFYAFENEATVEIVVGDIFGNNLAVFLELYGSVFDRFVEVVGGSYGQICIFCRRVAFVFVANNTIDVAHFFFFKSEIVGNTMCVVVTFYVVHVEIHMAESSHRISVEITFNKETGSAVFENTEVAFISEFTCRAAVVEIDVTADVGVCNRISGPSTVSVGHVERPNSFCHSAACFGVF